MGLDAASLRKQPDDAIRGLLDQLVRVAGSDAVVVAYASSSDSRLRRPDAKMMLTSSMIDCCWMRCSAAVAAQ